jgi:molybdopterin molybdotransferase
MTDVKHTWTEIEAWLATHAAPMLRSLRPPASADAIAQLFDAIGATPPSVLLESLAIHDGQARRALGLIAGWRLLSVGEIIEQYRMQQEMKAEESDPILDATVVPDAGVQRVWWHESWIPIADDGAANNICIDLAPADGGTHGQLITWFHDRGRRQVVTVDFAAWLALAATAMRNGNVDIERAGDEIVNLDYHGWKARGPA